MNDPLAHAPERLIDLLADRATEGLDARESQELNGLLADHPSVDPNELDWVAAMVDLSLTSQDFEPMPTGLRDQVILRAEHYFNETGAAAKTVRNVDIQTDSPNRNRFAWYLAAASIFVALAGWWQVLIPSSGPESQAAAFAKFLGETDDVISGNWNSEVEGYEKVVGEFAWSGKKQAGFMRFVNLPPNDPNVAQYQLWIVDPNRDKHPIDGGVFDVGSFAEAIVPIDAKLQVDQPNAFAITLEKPGGVVVSGGPLLIVGACPK